MNRKTRISGLIWMAPAVLLISLLLVSTAYASDELPAQVEPADGTAVESSSENSGEENGSADITIAGEGTEEIVDEPADGEDIEGDVVEDSDGPIESDVEEPVDEEGGEESPAIDSEIINDGSESGEIGLETEDPQTDQAEITGDEVEEDAILSGSESTILASGGADESGNSETVITGDPWFKVGSVTYRFMYAGGCSSYPDSATSKCFEVSDPIDEAIAYIEANSLLPTDRMIYVGSGTYDGFTIDGSTYPILGQLKGVIGEDGSSTTTINGDILVSSALLSFTLSGFSVNGNVTIQNSVGTVILDDLDVENSSGSGIDLDTEGSVVLTNVESSDNAGWGAYISSYGSTSYTVKITNSEFDDNDSGTNRVGLQIDASGAITLDGVSVSRNRGSGARFYSFSSLTIKNSIFNDNYADPDLSTWGYGLYVMNTAVASITLSDTVALSNENTNIFIYTYGNVKITDVNVQGSITGAGMYIDNSKGISATTVTITNGNFNENYTYGLQVCSQGNIALKNIIANSNTTNDGVLIDNSLGTGKVSLAAVWIGNDLNEFCNNGGFGLEVYSASVVALSNLNATENGDGGVYIDNSYGTGSVTVNTTYTKDWVNNLSGNLGADGIYISSYGSITLAYIDASSNAGYGIYLTNSSASSPRAIQISYSSADSNAAYGLMVKSSGNITLLKCGSFNSNGTGGTYTTGASLNVNGVGNVTITGTSNDEPTQFNDNPSMGLTVYANGKVILNKIQANDNGLIGVYIDNQNIPGKTVSVSNGIMDNNSSSGLEIYSKGAITLNTIQANSNGNYGASLDNCRLSGSICTGSGNVIVTASAYKTNTFSDNSNTGLYISSNGNILITNLTANGNTRGHGAEFTNLYSGSTGNISLTATSDQFNYFLDNSYNGLRINSYGKILINRVVAESNGMLGAALFNNLAATPKLISVANSAFNYNNNDGLLIMASGGVNLSGVQAYQNSVVSGNLDESGVTVHEYITAPNQNSSTTTSDVWTFDGVSGHSVTITLESSDFYPILRIYDLYGNLVASDYNTSGNDYATVTFTTSLDSEYYIYADSRDGDVGGNYILELNDPSNSNNSYPDVSGIEIVNTSGSGAIKVTKSSLMGYGIDAYDNSVAGIYIITNSAVNLNSVNSMHNGSRGLGIDATTTDNASIIISYGDFDENYEGGLSIYTKGCITLINVSAHNTYGANGYGAYLDNHYSSSAFVTIKATGSNICDFSNNNSVGLYIDAGGAITLVGVNSSSNTGRGAQINNTTFALPKTVSISNSTFNQNSSDGLIIGSYGNVVLTNVDACGNSLSSGYLDASTGQTQYEHLGDYNENDIWWFSSTSGVSVTIEVDSSEFSPEIVVYSETGSILATASGGGGSNVTYVFTPTEDGEFYVDVSGGNGRYDISLNDPSNANSISMLSIMGIEIDNCQESGGICQGSGNVIIKSTGSNSSDFSGNNYYGSYIKSGGSIGLTNMSASTNALYGVYAFNTLGTSGITVKNTNSKSSSCFNENYYYGLLLQSNGAIIVSNVTASSNGYSGAYLDTSSASGSAPISVTKGRFYDNGMGGLYAIANGAININDVISEDNTTNGVELHNDSASSNQPVTVKKARVNSNNYYGLYVASLGTITIDNIIAENNTAIGASLRNDFSGATGTIIISNSAGENRFNNNGTYGLFATSLNSISGTKITAQNNGTYGVYISNDGGSGNINLNYMNTSYNLYTGLYVKSVGGITVNHITSLCNGSSTNGDGVYLYASNPISILNSVAQGNYGGGFEVWISTPYLPTITNTSYMGNDANNNGDDNLLITHY